MRKKLIYPLVYLVCLLVFFEVTSIIFTSTPLGKKCIIGLGRINSDAAWRIRWEMSHIDKSEESHYTCDVFDPHRGWKLKSNLVDLSMFDGKRLNTNSKGIRDSREFSYEKSEKKRILLLGDSFTFGEEVNDNETYSYYLQEMLPSTEVINLGVHGYGHDQMLIYFEEEGIKYNPDIVILGFVELDMARNTLQFRDFSKPKYELTNGKLTLTNYPVPPPETFLEKKLLRFKFADLLSILYHGIKKKIGLEKEEAKEITTAILDVMVQKIRSIGALPVFVHLPVSEEMTRFDEDLYLYDFCKNRNVLYASIHPYFISESRKGITFDITKHWSAKEHYIAAKVIKIAIVSENVSE